MPLSNPRVALTLTTLEDRTTPAGNVTAFVGGGVLNVIGDDLGNAIRIDKTGGASVFIRSLDGTTINGSTLPQPFGDIYWGYDIKLAGGDDRVVIRNVKAKELSIDGGNGTDKIEVQNVRIRRETTITGGDGNDTVRLSDSTLRRRTTIDLGGGDDTLALDSSKIKRRATLNGGSGNNAVFWSETNLSSRTQILNFQTQSSILPDSPLTPPVLPPSPPAPPVPPGQPPVAANDSATVAQGNSIVIPVRANDAVGNGTLEQAVVTIATNPSLGSVTNPGDGTLVFTSTSTSGTDSFTYTLTDSTGLASNSATVTVAITSGNGNPNQPAVFLSTTSPDPTFANSITVTARFDESVSGLTASDFSVTNGTVSDLATTDSKVYTFTVSPVADGVISIGLPANSAQDVDGNGNAAASAITIRSIRTDEGLASEVPNLNPIDDPSVRVTESSLRIKDVVTGSGNTVVGGSRITVFYTGYLEDGTVFDQRRSPDEPITFELENLIPGFQEGMIGMQPGGIRQLYIPFFLAYGEQGQGDIPPLSNIIFDIKLVSVA